MRRMFSENQIKSIAQQYGGTKLYLHRFDDTGDRTYFLISSIKETWEDTGSVLFTTALALYNKVGYPLFYQWDNDTLLYIDADNSFQAYGILDNPNETIIPIDEDTNLLPE